MNAALWDAVIAARPGHALIQHHDTDGSLLREFHAWAEERGLAVRIYPNNTHGAHEVTLSRGGAIVVHDMNDSYRPTEALGDWSPAQHVAMGVAA